MAFDLSTARPVEQSGGFDLSTAKPVEDNGYDMSEYVEPVKRFGKEVARQVGLAARMPVQAAVGIPGVVSDALTGVYNTAADAAQGKGKGFRFQPASVAADRLMTAAGLPEPKDATERIVQSAGTAMTGAGGQAALAGKVANAVPKAASVIRSLSEGIGRQTLGAGLGGAAAQTTAEMGGGPVAQTAAAMGASLVPSGVPYTLGRATKAVLRGSDKNIPRMQENIRAFENAGTTPTAGQASESRLSRAWEGFQTNTPGGAGPMYSKATTQAAEIGSEAEKLADSLSTKSTPFQAGLAIEKGLTGPDGFLSDFKKYQGKLYERVDKFIKPDTRVSVSNTKQTLARLNEDIEGAENLSKWFKNHKIVGIEEAVNADAAASPAKPTYTKVGSEPGGHHGSKPIYLLGPDGQPLPTGETAAKLGGIPYEAVKKLRTLVGAELEGGGMTSDVPRSKWKALYASLSQDLDQAAASTGSDAAVKAMSRANAFSRAGYARIEDVLDKVSKRATPEDIYKAATSVSDMQAGATKIASVLKSLKPEERDVVKSAFIRRMGLATPGNQNAAGEVFSAQTFLTNWNRMSSEAKAVMFSGREGEVARKLNDIAKVASNIKEGSKAFANPSGTAKVALQAGGVIAPAQVALSGHPVIAAWLLAGEAGNYITAGMMTSRKFVDWLAKASKMSPSAVGSVMNALPRAMQGQPQDVQDEASAYLKALMQQGQR